MTIESGIEQIQFCYPQIYYACHTRHTRTRSGPSHISGRDSEILVHLDRVVPTSLSALARHMGLGASTLSEALSRLEQFDYVTKQPKVLGDRRRVGLLLTNKGHAAVRVASVLEPARVRTVLQRLSARERAVVLEGMRLLARACRPKAN